MRPVLVSLYVGNFVGPTRMALRGARGEHRDSRVRTRAELDLRAGQGNDPADSNFTSEQRVCSSKEDVAAKQKNEVWTRIH